MDPAPLVEPMLARATEAFGRAVRSGVFADGVGTAFLAGYRAAVSALVPLLAPPLLPALAATETGPLHPREVRTSLVDGRVTGSKRYVTGVPGADRALVLASAGQQGGRQRLVAAIVSLEGEGVTVRCMPPSPFVPDVPHAEIDFESAPVLSEIAGDGWADVVRPFRTAEDIHVIGAVLGYLVGVGARNDWSAPTLSALCASISALSALASSDPSAAGTHLTLAGTLVQIRTTLASLPWERTDPDEAARWRRDEALLSVAERARIARLDRAWASLRER